MACLHFSRGRAGNWPILSLVAKYMKVAYLHRYAQICKIKYASSQMVAQRRERWERSRKLWAGEFTADSTGVHRSFLLASGGPLTRIRFAGT